MYSVDICIVGPHQPMAANYQTIYQITDDDNCSPDIYSGGGTLGISGWGCATRTLEPLAYTRAPELVSAGFCYPIIE